MIFGLEGLSFSSSRLMRMEHKVRNLEISVLLSSCCFGRNVNWLLTFEIPHSLTSPDRDQTFSPTQVERSLLWARIYPAGCSRRRQHQGSTVALDRLSPDNQTLIGDCTFCLVASEFGRSSKKKCSRTTDHDGSAFNKRRPPVSSSTPACDH